MRHAPYRKSNSTDAQNSQPDHNGNHNQDDLQSTSRLGRRRYCAWITWRRRGWGVTCRRSAGGNRRVGGWGIRGSRRGCCHRRAAVCAELLVGWDFCPTLSTVDSHADLLVFLYTSGVFCDVLPATCQYTSIRAPQARLLIAIHRNEWVAAKPSQCVQVAPQDC